MGRAHHLRDADEGSGAQDPPEDPFLHPFCPPCPLVASPPTKAPELCLARISCCTACLRLATPEAPHSLALYQLRKRRLVTTLDPPPPLNLILRSSPPPKGFFPQIRDNFTTGKKKAGTSFQLPASLCCGVFSDQCTRQRGNQSLLWLSC